MAEEVVVKEILTDAKIQSGAELIRHLDKKGLSIRAAFWFFDSESNSWRLIIASPVVRLDGPKKVYRVIQSALKINVAVLPGISLSDVSVIEETHPLILQLSTVIKTSGEMSAIRFARCIINGQFIEDAYIYRMKAAPQSHRTWV